MPDDVLDDVVCCVTGRTGPGITRKRLIGKSFCDQAVLVTPESQYVGLPAWSALRYKWERMACWLAGDGDMRLFRGSEGRKSLRDTILNERYPSTPWAGYITTSYKKHGALRAPVNAGARRVWQYDEMRADLSDRVKIAGWWKRLHNERVNGISRAMLETLRAKPIALRSISVTRWTSLLAWATTIHRDPAYRVLCYLLPSKDEIEGK